MQNLVSLAQIDMDGDLGQDPSYLSVTRFCFTLLSRRLQMMRSPRIAHGEDGNLYRMSVSSARGGRARTKYSTPKRSSRSDVGISSGWNANWLR
jgi:hypothetical protein